MKPESTGRALAGVLIVALVASLSFASLVATGARNEEALATAATNTPERLGQVSAEPGVTGGWQ